MKKILLFFVFLATFACTGQQAKAENITDFKAEIKVNTDASIDVRENISYDFGTSERHGIYRDILRVQPNDQGAYQLKIDVQSVQNSQGQDQPFSVEKNGVYTRVKIGDPNKTTTGTHNYIISYKVLGAINYFGDHDELYWNATGNAWPVGIAQASASVIVPGSQAPTVQCYAGADNSKSACLTATASLGKADFSQANLGSKEGLTIVVGWPKGLVAVLDRGQFQISKTAYDNILQPGNFGPIAYASYLIPLLLIGWLTRQYRASHTAKSRGTIIAEYDVPDKLRPAEVGIIQDNQLQNKELSAEIIQLAIDGYLIIERTSSLKGLVHDYTLHKLKEGDTIDSPYAQRLFNKLFGASQEVKIKDLKDSFYTKLPEIQKEAFVQVVTKGYFKENPQDVIKKYTVLAIIMFIAATLELAYIRNLIIFPALLISAIAAIIFAFFMPALTELGAATKDKIKGLKLYLSVAEKDRIDFHNAPEKNPQTFQKFLPYAMVMGVEKKWAGQFADIYMEAPTWYSDPTMTTFNAVMLADSMSHFATASTGSMSSASNNSSGFGGGFSGGGGGGGGGGSW